MKIYSPGIEETWQSPGIRVVDQDLERALTEAEELAEQIAREKEAEQSENSPGLAKKQAGEDSSNETSRSETGQAETGHKRDGGTSITISTYHVRGRSLNSLPGRPVLDYRPGNPGCGGDSQGDP